MPQVYRLHPTSGAQSAESATYPSLGRSPRFRCPRQRAGWRPAI